MLLRTLAPRKRLQRALEFTKESPIAEEAIREAAGDSYVYELMFARNPLFVIGSLPFGAIVFEPSSRVKLLFLKYGFSDNCTDAISCELPPD